jgi:hypothetical protein
MRYQILGRYQILSIMAAASLALVIGCGGGTSSNIIPGGSAGSTAAGSAGAGSGSAGANPNAGSAGAGSTAGATGSAGENTAGTGGSGTAGVGTAGAGGTGGAGTAGAGGIGGAGTAGAGGTAPHADAGADTKPVGGTAGATGGAKPAIATLVQANGNGFNGTATFTPDAMGFITLTLMVKNCGNGAHGIHLGLMPDCGNDGMNSGMHWTPKGDGLGDVTCAGGGGGMGMATYKTPSAGYWTIGTGDPTSDILMRSIVIDQGPTAMPKTPMGCGVPRTD